MYTRNELVDLIQTLRPGMLVSPRATQRELAATYHALLERDSKDRRQAAFIEQFGDDRDCWAPPANADVTALGSALWHAANAYGPLVRAAQELECLRQSAFRYEALKGRVGEAYGHYGDVLKQETVDLMLDSLLGRLRSASNGLPGSLSTHELIEVLEAQGYEVKKKS